jgi:hypothetical protein
MNGIAKRPNLLSRGILVAAIAVLVTVGSRTQKASADQGSQPIVGLWEITVSYGPSLGCPTSSCVYDHVFSGWTSDGLEFDQDAVAPILTGEVCYGTWIKLGSNTFGLTHPFFDFDAATGVWAGTSGYFNYTVTVSPDGRSFTGKQNGTDGVPGPNPYAGTGSPYTGLTLSATKIAVNRSLLP